MSAKFDPTISLGNLITAAAMLVTLAVGWGVHTTTVGMLKTNDETQAKMIELHTRSIHALELQAQRVDAHLSYISKGVDELKGK
ncbi:MAG: hypothetical protein JNJ83_10890 [Verrucomicrobiaceae bacterium]|nr:hypothetical protein [Verrucomicrobiaceae bacterium]